jgi:hypothetical protein
VNPAATIASCIACSWNSGTPSVRPSTSRTASLGYSTGLLALAPPQVRVHHAALDRPGPHDRHLDHQVVETPRLEPGQHRHLRPALDLEHADRVGAADHLVDRVVRRLVAP